jgi:hypothetical protein
VGVSETIGVALGRRVGLSINSGGFIVTGGVSFSFLLTVVLLRMTVLVITVRQGGYFV